MEAWCYKEGEKKYTIPSGHTQLVRYKYSLMHNNSCSRSNPSDIYSEKRGAPCQCWSPYFCLIFVHCPHFVLFLSCFCLHFVPFLSSVPLLSPFCPQVLSFVLFWTRFCHHWSQNCPTFVPIWSYQSIANGEDKYWTKMELNHFSIFNLVTLQGDKNGTKIGHLSQICPLFVQAPYSFYI